MPPTTSYKRGDVVLVPFPFTDLSGAKQRPALIVSPDSLNAIREDVVVAAITSQMPPALPPDEVLIGARDLAPTGLLKSSVVKTGKLFTVHQGLIRRKIGTMPESVVLRVLEILRQKFQP